MQNTFKTIFSFSLCLASFQANATSLNCDFQAKAAAFEAVAKDYQESNFAISNLNTKLERVENLSANRSLYMISAEVVTKEDTAEEHLTVEVNTLTCKIIQIDQGGF